MGNILIIWGMNEPCNTLARHNEHISEKQGITQQVTYIYMEATRL